MMKKILLILLLVISLVFVAGCADDEPEMPPPEDPVTHLFIFDESNDGETYTVGTGDQIRLRLPENPTTGYEWVLDIPDGLILTHWEFVAPDTDLLGAPGTRIWEMTAAEPGTYTLAAKEIRQWEDDVEPVSTFTLTLVVEEGYTPDLPVPTPSPTYVFDEHHDGQTHKVSSGAVFQLSLPDQSASTGYGWDLNVPEGLVVLSEDMIPPENAMPGAPAMRIWRIKAEMPGTYQINADLVQPWEGGGRVDEAYTLTLIIE